MSKRSRFAHHEAGHSVLSASINDAPRLISIVGNRDSLGRARYRFEAAPRSLVQVFLAGYAAEHVLTGVRPRRMANWLGFAIVAETVPGTTEIAERVAGSDEAFAVHAVLEMGTKPDADAIRAEVTRFYEISRASIVSVWPAVQAVARELLRHDELDSEGFFAAINDFDIYKPVRAVQEAHGLARA